MIIYLAGPMRGYDQLNFPAFDAAATYLRDRGHKVYSPADIDREMGIDPTQPLPTWWTIAGAMRRDIATIAVSEAIVLLPGWEASEGVRHELAAARACGLHIYEFAWSPTGLAFVDVDEAPFEADATAEDEVIVVDPETGGRKGVKLARFDLLPWDIIRELAEHFGRGARKHGDHNWRRGYAWSLNLGALHRHLEAWWSGEDNDPETGSCHLLAVIWHAMALRWFQRHGKGTDDRPVMA